MITFAQAALHLSEQIIACYGCNPDLVDDLTFQAVRCPHLGSNRRGIAIIASPTGSPIRTPVMASYFGDSIHAA